VHPAGIGIFAAGGFKMDLFSVASLSAGFMLGMMGLPHLLIRLFTVPNEAEARKSVVVAVGIIGGVFALLLLVVGPAAIAYVLPNPEFATADGKLIGGGNMAVLHLATALGGAPFFGVMAGIAFATILAVVAGLTISAASATSHDLATFVLRGRKLTDKAEVRVFRGATLAVSVLSVLLAMAFQAENVAFLAALAFAVAASTNFPVLILSLYWRGTTAVGAMAGGFVGLVASVALIILGPAVWVKILGNAAPVFPSDYPTLVTAPLAFLVAIAVSLATRKSRVTAG
jgi:cation/acetate symporter